MEQRQCPNCGNMVGAAEAFCPFCGKPAEQRSEPTPKPQMNQDTAPLYGNAYAAPTPYPMYPQVSGKRGGGMGWIVFLRVMAWILFGAMVVTGFISGAMFIDYEPGIAILYIAGSILGAFLLVAGMMISLNNASNLRKIADNSAEIVDLLKRK